MNTLEITISEGVYAGKDVHHESAHHMKLPVEVLGVVAEHLVHDYRYRTCAALNATSSALFAETVPTLWRWFISWGAKVHDLNLSTVRLPSGKATIEQYRDVQSRLSRKRQIWEKAEGASWIRYCFIPSPVSDAPVSPHSAPIYDLVDPVVYARRKASIQISMLPDMHGTFMRFPSIVIGLNKGYDYASGDILELSQALCQLKDTGNNQVKAAFGSSNGISILPCEVPSGTVSVDRSVELQPVPTIKDAVSRLSGLPYHRHGCKARTISIRGNSQISCQSLVLGFIDILHLLRLEGCNDSESEIFVFDDRMETILGCAKAFQASVKSFPRIAAINCTFNLTCTSSRETLVAGTEKIISTIRGTFLRPQNHLPLADMGTFIMSLKFPGGKWLAWSVSSEANRNRINTTFRLNDGTAKVVYQDVCGGGCR